MQGVLRILQDNYDSSEMLRTEPPSWMIRASSRPGGLGPLLEAYLPSGAAAPAPASSQQCEQTSSRPHGNHERVRPAAGSPAPALAAAPAPGLDTFVELSTQYPLVATAPNVSAAIKQKSASWQLWQVTKTMNLPVPKYGAGSNRKFLCFSYMTEGHSCPGYFVRSGKKKPCDRLHVNLDPSGPFWDDPSSHFIALVCFLKTPGIANHFIPTDAFATSQQQFRDAESSL
jgi:hypothetical protein